VIAIKNGKKKLIPLHEQLYNDFNYIEIYFLLDLADPDNASCSLHLARMLYQKLID